MDSPHNRCPSPGSEMLSLELCFAYIFTTQSDADFWSWLSSGFS